MDDRVARFTALYDQHYPKVLACARAWGPWQAAEDVAAETFLVAWRRLADLPAEPLPWLLGVTANLVRNQLRAGGRHEALAERVAALSQTLARASAGRPVRLAVALGVAATVAVTAASLALPRAERQRTDTGRQRPAGAGQPAAFLLVSAKRLATAPAASTGPYWYERTRTEVMALINAYLPPDRQVRDPYWVRASWTTHTWLPKGEGVIHTLDFQQQRFEFLSPRDQARWKASGSPALNVLQRGVGAASESPTDGLDLGIPLAEFLRLQPDPAALQARIRQLAAADYPPEGERRLFKVNPPKAGKRGNVQQSPQIVQKGVRPWAPGERERRIAGSMFDIATTWLRCSQQRPALQGALYRVLGGIPGVRYVGPVTDNAGRRGEAVGMVHDDRGDGSRTEIRVVIDPASGRLLAEQALVLKAPTARPGLPEQPAGTLQYSTAFLDSHWAGRPAAGWPRNPPGVKGPVG